MNYIVLKLQLNLELVLIGAKIMLEKFLTRSKIINITNEYFSSNGFICNK